MLNNLFIENSNVWAITILSVSLIFILCLSIYNKINIKKEKVFFLYLEIIYIIFRSLIKKYGFKNLVFFFFYFY